MGTTADEAPEAELELSVAEQWTVHARLLESVERAFEEGNEPRPAVELALLQKTEDGIHSFAAFELDRLRHECEHHASAPDTPDCDRKPLRAVADRIGRQCPPGPSD